MTDIASLALRVDALEVNQASEALKRMQKAGGDAEDSLGSSVAGIEAGFKKVAVQAAALFAAIQTLSGASREWYDARALKRLPSARGVVSAVPLTENNELAFTMWLRMGKMLNWSALTVLLEYFEVSDVELVLESLFYIDGRETT